MTNSQRSAIYARYSDERQNPLSIDQQIRKCREHADRHGLQFLDAHVYVDEAISGATDERAGLQRLLKAVRQKPRPFDVILVDDTSRLSRDLAHSLEIVKQMRFAGVRVVFVSQGFDTSAPQMQTLLTVHGLVDSLYLDELGKKTFRGVEQRAIQGLHTGGRVFGYKRVPIQSATEQDNHGRPIISGVRLEIDPIQAATIRTIFGRYAKGDSLKRIAVGLNGNGILSPQPQKGRVSRSWCPSSVRHILLNERYAGIVNWGRTFKLRSPETGKRVYRRKPQNEWRKKEIPEQRIVPDQLWNAVQERFRIIRAANQGRTKTGRALASPYIFTGLLECSQCHGSVTIVSGVRKGRPYRRYGCSMHAHRGDTVCTNSLLIPQPRLEEQLLAGLQATVLNPGVMDYALKSFERQLLREQEKYSAESGALEKRIEDLQRKIRNVSRAIAEGTAFKSLLEQIDIFQRDIQETEARLRSGKPESTKIRMQSARRFVESELGDLRKLLNQEPRLARAGIAKHLEKIVLTPEGGGYTASGNWNILGLGSYDGAGGQNRTGYARLFRAALYQ
jgi:site-specific DNA recombinase